MFNDENSALPMGSCEVVWVRCNEPIDPLLRLVNRTGQRLSVVEKCDAPTSASGLRVPNVGEEGFGYLSWIVERWDTLPPCAFLLHGGWKRRPRFWDMVVELLPCAHAHAQHQRAALAVPLSHLFVERRGPPAGMDVLMRSLRASGVGPELFPDWLRQRALNYYATNVWFVTREALRRRPYQLWAALRDAALVPGQPQGYSAPRRGEATTRHSSVPVAR